jgi:glycosyltransferase involved in cell wall biosynthesis
VVNIFLLEGGLKVAIFSPEMGRTNGGKGQHATHVLSCLCPLLCAAGCEVRILVPRDARVEALPKAVKIVRLPVDKNTGTWRVLWGEVYAPFICWGADVFLSLSSFPLSPLRAARKMVIVHDLLPLQTNVRSEWGGRKLSKSVWYGGLALRMGIAKSDTIFALSRSVAAEVERELHVARNRMVIIHHGLDHDRFRPVADPTALAEFRERHSLPPAFYLFVGPPHEGKKNLSLIARTYAQFKGDDSLLLPVVIVGGERNSRINDSDSALIREAGQAHLFRYLGFVSDADLPLFYSSARALLHPARHEGFGTPLLEAMGCGTPVVASNRASIPEVVGDAAILIDPCDPASLYEALRKVNDQSTRETLTARGLQRAQECSWQRSAELIAEQILQRAVAPPRHQDTKSGG